MDKQELRERYEATGEERFYEQANSLYEDALAREPGDARLLLEYGYLLECHARYAVRAAITHYQRAVDAEPRSQKAHLQLISPLAAVQELDDRVFARYERWMAEDPGEPVGYRLLACWRLITSASVACNGRRCRRRTFCIQYTRNG
jgi:hypothetical protein